MEKILREILKKAVSAQHAEVSIEIEIPKEEGFGDLSTPIAMGLAKPLKKPPRKIAEDIVNSLENKEIFEKIDIAGPGFINFTFSKRYLCDELKELIEKQDNFLIEDIGKGRRVQIEFVSANPTGPLHLGHGRGAALGAALSNLLTEAGYRVEREYYINDAGRQVRLLGMSVLAKYKQLIGIEYPFPEDGYRGEYIEDLAKEFKESQKSRVKSRELKDEELLEEITDFAYKKMLAAIKKDLEDFGVFFDSWQSEKVLYEKGEVVQAINDLKKRGYIYEKEGATWFKSTEFGDDKDRVIIKREGDYTYFAPDIAYHRKKVEKGFDEIIDIWGADHHGYVPRMQAVIQALGYPKEHLKVLLV
ncbi:MAG: arginine--tRNA ligase, partial [Thermodesulfovibrionales bacterium]|nr:arginine--tRNA ligase [Thermodesulfovibrionales bacterium]